MVAWLCRTIPREVDPTDAFTRRYDWSFDGRRFEWPLALPRAYYETHRRRHRVYDYGMYVADEFTQRIVAGLCASMERQAEDHGFDDETRLRFAAAFVQHLPYTPDSVSTDYSNYPRYPIETLVDETGDCEDTSLLLAAILHGLGVEVGLVEFPTHLGVGIVAPDLPTNFEFDGTAVTYLEATATGWDPGTVPPKYADEPATFHRIDGTPAIYCGWRAEREGKRIGVAGTLTNVGAGAGRDVRVYLAFADPDDRTVGRVSEHFGTVSTNADPTWGDTVRVGDVDRLTPEWHVAVKGTIHDRGAGEPRELVR